MTDREKLIALLDAAHDEYYKHFDMSRGYMATLADHLLANGVTFAKDTDVPSKWISVKDRLPSRYERILVWCESKTIKKHITACTYMGDGKFSRHVRCVTHWMPLPEPPKEAKK